MDEQTYGSQHQQEIHDKGFSITDYGKIKVGPKILDDAVLTLGDYKKTPHQLLDKRFILQATYDYNLPVLRQISRQFYISNGIYQSACDYFANLYRYDWYVVPEVIDKGVKEEKVLKEFANLLRYLDNSHVKQLCNDIAFKVIRDGAYYGYLINNKDQIIIQDLPPEYCRSRYNVGNSPAIEFNMRYFDDCFRDINYRMRVLKMFPQDFQRGYVLYKQGKLQPDVIGDTFGSWYLLDVNCGVKFSLNKGDMPLLVTAIPAILDLDAAQDLDRKKQMQQLLKILIQKLPLDKNGDLLFDIDEARDIHSNAVQMLSRAIGVDVLTTFAEVDAINLSDKNTTTTKDELEKVERTVYNNLGISQKLFNTDGNMSLEKSILTDEGQIRTLLLQFNTFFDKIVQQQSKNSSKFNFRLYMLETTIFNYKELSKLYKEQVQIGYSKMLPQIALGHSQSSILNTAYFENEVLNLNALMIPPLMSSTLNGEDLKNLGGSDKSTSNKNQNITEGNKSGRPTLEDDKKSDKTLANIESQS